MKLIEALNILRSNKTRNRGTLRYFLAAGLNPLHLKTFLAAELSLLSTDQTIEIQAGLYGDFLGNLERLTKADVECGLALIEWSDLDPRLGIRSTARWSSSECSDILTTSEARALRIQRKIEEIGLRLPLVLCFPTMPLPAFAFVPGWQTSSFEIDLRAILQSVSTKVSRLAQVRILSAQRIDLISPLGERLDVEAEVLTGFPYRLAHASALAALLARLTRNPIAKKGLITDLDDTLWRGVLGEEGIDGISWDLDRHSQMHAFYQRFVGALAAEGVLIGVASKNEHSLVEEAFKREDLALSPEAIFPIEANWGAKSQSVTRILNTWNVAPDSVVFVDDSLLELAEVKASHPDIECIQFPTADNAAVYNLTTRLRDLFGKSTILEEDSIRMDSIRGSHARSAFHDATAMAPKTFLEQTEAEMTFNFSKTPLDPRAFDLVNKTNQFNLNGKRYSESSWHNYFLNPASWLLLASYRDKYGPLGKIAVVAGRLDVRKIVIETWVMSCRAFSRRIEYKCLEELFARFDLDEIEFDYLRTDKNTPLCEFLRGIVGASPESGCTVSREAFEAHLDTPPQKVQEVTHE
jgi:FkbH-like protein